eukprot:TRINITY_DN3243_c0_g1_i1.p1 TRINITY_DN3243_c0_g1~~TRINITY_DN3243_c0_g1_i1.p1  ORF type:complete len:441 (+),score=59.26 TRINITY_DN3243_c0_g1_i1:201-1523(+)
MSKSHGRTIVAILGLISVVSILSLGSFKLDGQDPPKRMGRDLLQINSQVSWLHNIPRKTFNGTTVTASLWTESATDYYLSVVPMAIVPFAFGVISIVVGIAFCSFRFCFNKCGGVHPNPEGYSQRQKFFLRIAIFVNAALIIAMIVVGLVGSTMFQPAVDTLSQSVRDNSPKQENILSTVVSRLYAINPNASALWQPLGRLSPDYVSNTKSASDTGTNYLQQITLYRLLLLGFTFGMVLVVVVLGVISTIFRWAKPIMCSGLVGFFVIMMLWFNLGTHFVFSVTLADLCNDMNGVGIPQRLADRTLNMGQNYSNSGLSELCFCPGWLNCEKTYNLTLIFYGRISTQRDNLDQSDPNYAQNYNNLTMQLQNVAGIQTDLYYARDCLWINDVFAPMHNQCDSPVQGVIMVWATSFVLSVLLIVWIVSMILGYKRFQESEGFF